MIRTLRNLAWALCLGSFGAPAVAQETTQIVAVNTPLQYIAERLTQGDAEVVMPVPAQTDPSFWRPSISDISMVQSADLILLNGAGFATWVDRVSLPRSKTVNTAAGIEDQFIVTESITHSHGDGGEHSHEGLASYLWLDPTLAAAQAEAIAGVLKSRGLADASIVDDQLAALLADLMALDARTKTALGRFTGAKLIATHPRYEYFARRYDLSIVSLDWEAGADPTADQLAALKAKGAETGAQVLIWEAAPSEAALQSTEAIGFSNVVFNPMANANEDRALIDALAASVENLADALGASATN